MTTLVLIPGWGLDAAMWESVRKVLPASVVVDMHAPVLPEGPLVAVGHSLGFAWALRQPVRWRAVVSIGGFARFTRADDFADGTPPRLLERMRARFAVAPDAVHRDFLQRAGATPCAMPARLDEGLRWLTEWDERSAVAALDVPVLALAAEDDQIVPPAMARACFPEVVMRPDGGHALPVTQPEWCAAQIRAFST